MLEQGHDRVPQWGFKHVVLGFTKIDVVLDIIVGVGVTDGDPVGVGEFDGVEVNDCVGDGDGVFEYELVDVVDGVTDTVPLGVLLEVIDGVPVCVNVPVDVGVIDDVVLVVCVTEEVIDDVEVFVGSEVIFAVGVMDDVPVSDDVGEKEPVLEDVLVFDGVLVDVELTELVGVKLDDGVILELEVELFEFVTVGVILDVDDMVKLDELDKVEMDGVTDKETVADTVEFTDGE